MAAPQEPPVETLRRFVYLVDQLQTRKIVKDEELKSSLQIKGKINQPIAMHYHQPDEESLRSYLLDFRKFTMAGELVFANRVFNVAYRHITGEDLVYQLTQARQKWKESMTRGEIAFLVNGQALQPEHVLDLWINGYYFHDDLEKARKLEALSNVPLSRWLFINVLVTATQLLLYSAHVVKVALRDGLVSETPVRG